MGFELSEEQVWSRRWLEMTDLLKGWSHDPSTKLGAVIVRPDNSIVSYGVNNFPHGVADTSERLENREVKYELVVHAETNALLHAHESVRGYALYCTTVPCCRCAVNILSAGIARVIYWEPTADYLARWQESVNKTLALFDEARILYYPVRRDHV